MSDLTGKVALVTGGSRGIGAATARRLADEGAAVALTYVQAADQAREVAQQIEAAGGRAVVMQADLTDPTAAAEAVEQTVRELGRIDILVNNAGFLTYGPLAEVSVTELDRVLAVDIRSVFLAAQAAARHMGDGGRIISIGSCFNGRVPGANFVLQATAKSALVGLTKGLARELGPRGITVSIVDPGPIDTDMNSAAGETADFQRSLTALGRYGEAEDIAAAVAYLAGPGGRYITGTTLAVDGGYTI
ncbi:MULTISPECIES: SDR family NAD(P)-dependent oxidoreductase [unclassified Kitasatospora]|uniref:SDR family NAD(P)-dependent oxidoreductase n=1 Tax=unclassified Kitasatospora TaxID=2633591 RepID=UPI0007106A5F|nr:MULTISPECIES: 3-oxoacyl-ACP reductase family protein [unclassified Kitasatospora]KQV17140.1 oxidoreductase [Kitasatospora sp. Root107]KRB70015.1 oxidoreductase [Kitasatospora sp. Root187]